MIEDFRWNVEVRPGDFHDVGAASVTIDAATLIFRDEEGELVLAYAPGHWMTVSPQ